ncbi:MAG: DEAD/DEAH box helicase [bacterium]
MTLGERIRKLLSPLAPPLILRGKKSRCKAEPVPADEAFDAEPAAMLAPEPNEFETLGLPEPVLAGIRDAGFVRMTPIQRLGLPITLAGQDLCGQAQTGTGKTATFLITLFARFLPELDPRHIQPLALVLAPTRELAQQIWREGMALGLHTPFRLVAVYGGEGFTEQEARLRAGVDVVVGTPGRLLDFMRRGVLDVSKIRFLVIDEADRLLDMGFWDELRDILRKLPPAKKRQSMLFSATLDHRSKRIASAHMNAPQDVAVQPEQVTAEGVDQLVYHVSKDKKFPLLTGILSREDVTKGLIFANMKITVTWLARKLKEHGYQVEMLTGDMAQGARNKVLDRFKRGSVPLLVASDVASRGLHIDDVTHIINYDVPQDPEDYVHRIGRTARAGKRGKAYTLACDDCCWYLPAIEELIGSSLPFEIPGDQDFGEDRTPHLTVHRMLRESRQQRRDRPRYEAGRSRPRPPSRQPLRPPSRQHARAEVRPPAGPTEAPGAVNGSRRPRRRRKKAPPQHAPQSS